MALEWGCPLLHGYRYAVPFEFFVHTNTQPAGKPVRQSR